MKTPMQELIDEMKLARVFCDDPEMEMDIWHTLDVLIAKGEVLIEKEKEVIMDAFSSGEHQQGFEGEAEQYYNETFNAKEK